MATNDFHLNFGSNAKTWASELSGELRPATNSITALTDALEKYDSALAERKGTGSPLDSLFTRLDSVSQKFADLTGTLASTFESAIRGIGMLQGDIASLLRSVESVTDKSKGVRKRQKIDAVSDADLQSASALSNRQNLRVNATAVNKQLDRMSDITERLAPRVGEAADKLVILGRKVGNLQGASVTAIRGLESLEDKLIKFGEGVNVPTHAATGAAGTGPGATVNPGDMTSLVEQMVSAMRGLTVEFRTANIQAGRVTQQVEVAAKAVADEALETKRFTTTASSPQAGPERELVQVKGYKRGLEPIDDRLDEPARPGTYALGSTALTFRQSDIAPGETFNENYARAKALKKQYEEVQKTLPTAKDVDPQNGALLQRISDAFVRGGGVHSDAVRRTADRGYLAQSAALSESISANPNSEFLVGAQDRALLQQAKKAGLGQIVKKNADGTESAQFSEHELIKQAMALTTTSYIPSKKELRDAPRREDGRVIFPGEGPQIGPGKLPAARQTFIEDFLGQSLTQNPHQTFDVLGDTELTNIRKQMDQQILKAAQGEGRLPEYLENHPDKPGLYAGATARSYADDFAGERRLNYSAYSSARRQAQQKKAYFKDTGNEYDTSVKAGRLSSEYAKQTQLGTAREREEAAQKFYEEKVAEHSTLNNEGGSKQSLDALKQQITLAREAHRIAQERVKDAEAEVALERKKKADAVAFHRESLGRYDEVTKAQREASGDLRGILYGQDGFPGRKKNENGKVISTDPLTTMSDDDVAHRLNLKSERVKVDEPPSRLGSLQTALARAQQLLDRATNDPEGFAAAAKQKVSVQTVTRESLLPGIQERLKSAAAELQPGVDEEQRLKNAALQARAAQEERARARGVSEKEIQEAVKRRNAQRRADPDGFSRENLAAENRYRTFVNQRQAAETARQAELAELQQKAYEARAQKEAKLSPAQRQTAQDQRNLERLVGGGYSPSDLPAERAAIKARLANPEGRYEQARRELSQIEKIRSFGTAGREVRVATPESVFASTSANGDPEFKVTKEKMDAVKKTLGREVEYLQESITNFGTREVLPQITDKQRQQALAKSSDLRAAKFQPLLEKYGVENAAQVAHQPTAEIERVLLEAARKMDEAAVEQQRAADKNLRAADRADGFNNTSGLAEPQGRTTRQATDISELSKKEQEKLLKQEEKARQRIQRKSATDPSLDSYTPEVREAVVKNREDLALARVRAKALGAFNVTVKDTQPVDSDDSKEKKAKKSKVSAPSAAGETAAMQVERDLLNAEHDEVLARKRSANAALKTANEAGQGTPELRSASKEANAALRALNTRVKALDNAMAVLERETRESTKASGGGGGGRKPPKTPPVTGGPDDSSGDNSEPKPRPRSAAERSNDAFAQAQHLKNFSDFDPDVQNAVREAAAKAQVKPDQKILTDEQKGILLPAVHQFRDDPVYQQRYANKDAQSGRQAFAAGAGITLPGALGNQKFLQQAFALNKAGLGGQVAATTQLEAITARLAHLDEIRLEKNVKIREAQLAQFAAEEHQAEVRANPKSTPAQLALADRRVSITSRGLENTEIKEADAASAAAGGGPGGLSGLLANGGKQALRFMSFQIAFTGLEEVRKLVDSGIQAQTAFVRLQANLDATGRSARGLSADLGKISSDTAQPLEHTIQAAAELTGVLKNRGDLLEGTKVASELANITHGMLTAHEAAIGLRDVTDAYGLSGISAIRGVGDEITRISQVTGVSVKDVIEGTTQLAQEAHSFGLSQRQAAVLAAEVTKNTGETGGAAAEQVSRILSTLNNGKVQQLLEKTINPATGKAIATQEDFAGKVVNGEVISGAGDALTKLLAQYDQLAPQQRAAIDALVGSGRQARALTGLLRDAAISSELLKEVSQDSGALAEQNSRTLHTLGGELGQLGANFRRLGKDALDAGLFDTLGLVVKGLDIVLKTVDSVIRGLTSLFDSNPLTKNLARVGLMLGELTLAWKLFGKEAQAALKWVGLGGVANRLSAGKEVEGGVAAATAGTAARVARDPFFSPSASQLFLSPRYNPGGALYADEEAAGRLSGAERRDAAISARTSPVILPVNRGQQLLGRAGIEEEAQTAARARMAVSLESGALRLRNFGTAVMGVGASALSTAGPLVAFMVILQGITDAMSRSAKLKKDTNDVLDILSPKPSKPDTNAQHNLDVADSLTREGSQQDRRWNGYSPGFDPNSKVGRAGTVAWGVTPFGMIENAYGVATHPGDAVASIGDLVHGDFSGGNVSDKFNLDTDTFLAESTTKQNDAWNNPDALIKAQADIDKDFVNNARGWVKESGDKYAQATAGAYLIQLRQNLDDAAAHRLENLKGVADIDILSLQQLENAATFISSVTSLDSRTLRTDPKAMQQALSDTGVDPKSQIGGILRKSLTDDTQGRVEDTIAFDRAELPQLESQIAIKPLSDPDRDRLIKARDAVLANLQQQMTLLDQLATGNPTAMADILSKLGDFEGAGGQLKRANVAYSKILKTLDSSDPRFFQNLSAMMDNDTKIAQAKQQPKIDAANLDSARNPNSVRRARDSQAVAQANLDAAREAADASRRRLLAEQEARQQDLDLKKNQLTAFDANQISDPMSHEGNPIVGAIVSSDTAATRAGLVSNVSAAEATLKSVSAMVGANALDKAAAIQGALAAKASADEAVNQMLQDQVASAGALRVAILQASGAGIGAVDAAKVGAAEEDLRFAIKTFKPGSVQANNAQIGVIQAQTQARQDLHDQSTSAITLRGIIDNNRGDTVGAARANLEKANSDLAFAVRTSGSNSKEANAARGEAIQAQAAIGQAIDDRLNASLDLQISLLSNRGNDSDKRRILDDKVKITQNNLRTFLARGGDRNSAEGKKLQASANDASRDRINQAAEIQISTLDYQREMFKISASQEIKALQDILKNKKLSQDEARSINLKIKQLRDSSQGQFNLGDIKIPTPYEARRYIQTSAQGVAYQSTQITNTRNQFSFTGLSKNEVLAIIKTALGPTATQRSATTARK